ncbi:hypothetical protein CPB85DRAFT_612528 [Mucidula mucida]|nr:hypothetical protein CPB85DRAFT_612528 [Mucidula mucida]
MRSPVAFLTLAAAFVGGVFSQTINTPTNLAQCLPSLISWTGVSGAVQLFITSGDAPSGPTTHDLGSQSGTSFTYIVTEAPNSRLVFNIRTSTGAIFQTGIVTVTTGGNTDCLNSSGSGSASGTTSSAATSAGTTTSAAATTTATTAATGTTTATTAATSATRTTSRATGASTGASSAGSSATSASDNSAPTQYSMGIAGVVGAAVIALLA